MEGVWIPSPPVRRTNDGDPMVITSPPLRRTLDDATVIFVIGGPGSGKSTHCARLAAELDLIHLDVDAMLLGFEQTGPAGAVAAVKSAREEGKLPPVGLIMTLIKDEITWHVEDGDCTFLLDGFPCSIDHYLDYSRSLGVRHVIHLECSQDLLYFRSVDLLGIPLDQDAAELFLQHERIFTKRLARFKSECRQVIRFLGAKGIVSTVKAEDTIEEVYGQIKHVVDRLLDDFAPSDDEEDPSASSSTSSTSSSGGGGGGGVRVFHLDP
ncbi:hypothetical protein DTO212C5_8950 [Paecilomyces variotii]|nr:hypothetical protein DTO212C5_8950 [Paecilomyces variotii]